LQQRLQLPQTLCFLSISGIANRACLLGAQQVSELILVADHRTWLFPFFKPGLRFGCLLFRTVRIKPDASPTYPYFNHHTLRPSQELRIIWLTSPRIWRGGIDSHQRSPLGKIVSRFTPRNDHLAAGRFLCRLLPTP
jgi:hypothetical protein